MKRALKAGLRELAASALHHSGALRALQVFSRTHEVAPDTKGRRTLSRVAVPKFLILTYHRVGVGGVPIYSWLETEAFEAQMRYLRQHFEIISLDALLYAVQNGAPANTRAVAITFDDGYLGTYTEAFPILRKYRIPATVYLTVGSIESGEAAWYDRLFLALQVMQSETLECAWHPFRRFILGDKASRIAATEKLVQYLRTVPDGKLKALCAEIESRVRLPEKELRGCMLTWNHVREMQAAGITFGSHTMSHAVVAQLSKDDLESELRLSKQIIEARTAASVQHFAYPFGRPADCGGEATAVLKRLGYSSAVTTVEGTNVPFADPFALKRASIGTSTSLSQFALRISKLFFVSGTGSHHLDAASRDATRGQAKTDEPQAERSAHA